MPMKEIKHKLNGERMEFECTLLERSDRRAVLLYRIPSDVQVGDLVLPAGTTTYGHYWTDRPFNVYHWIAPDGDTLGYYVNLGDTVVLREDGVEWRDLAIDILRTPDGRTQVLDTDELEDLSPGLRRKIVAIRDQVLAELDEVVREVAAATAGLRREDSAR